jgi:hypothetical protein
MVIPRRSICVRDSDDGLLHCHQVGCGSCGHLLADVQQPDPGLAPPALVRAFYDQTNSPDLSAWLFGRLVWHDSPTLVFADLNTMLISAGLNGLTPTAIELMQRGYEYEAELNGWT